MNERRRFGTCGIANSALIGDSVLRLFSPQQNMLLISDDACGGLGSNISFVPPVTGTYYVHAGCYDESSCQANIITRIEP